jgi:drug/metabolite transporter (DMT)-like permease
MAVWVLGERFRGALAIGSLAALAGLALLTNAFAAGFHATAYDALAVATAIASAYIVVTIRLLHRDGEHTSTIFAAQCVYGLLLCTAPAIWQGVTLPGATWGMMFIAGACAAIGQLAMTRAFRDLPVGEGSLLQIFVPLGIAAGGALFFQERFTPHELIGAGLIICGTVFTVAVPRRGAASSL